MRRKSESVLRVLNGEELDSLSREFGVTAATLSEWRDDSPAAGQAGLQLKPVDEPKDRSSDITTLIGELTIAIQCQGALLRKHEERDPLACRMSMR